MITGTLLQIKYNVILNEIEVAGAHDYVILAEITVAGTLRQIKDYAIMVHV